MDSIQKDSDVISLRKVFVNYLHHWKVFAIVGGLSIVLAVLYLELYPKTYEIMSRMRIEADSQLGNGSVGLGEAAGLMKSFGLSGGSGTTISIEDELATLSSNQLLREMVLELGINVTYKKPFSFYSLYEECPIVVAPDSTTQKTLNTDVVLTVNLNADGSVKVKVKSGKDYSFSSLPATLNIDQGVFSISYKKPNDQLKSEKVEVCVSPADWIAEDIFDSFVIEEYSKTANTIELTCNDHDVKRGEDMLNTLMTIYNRKSQSKKKREGTKSMLFLDGRINGVMQELNNIEREIEAYKIKNQMTDIQYDVQFYAETMKDLRLKIIELETQDQIIRLLDNYIKDPKNKYSLVPPLMSAQDGEKGGAITAYNEALIEREKLQKSSKTNNPLVEIADSQLDKLRESAYVSIDNAQKSIQYVLSDLKSKEKILLDKMGNVPTYEREYLDYKRQQEVLQGVYLILLQKKEEIALSLGEEKDKGYIIDYAFVKKNPIAPRKLFAVLFVILLTVVVPVVYIFCKEQLVALIAEYRNSKQ